MATQPTALIAKHAVGAIDERIGDRRQVREQEQEPRHEGDGGCPREDLQNVAITRKLLQAANSADVISSRHIAPSPTRSRKSGHVWSWEMSFWWVLFDPLAGWQARRDQIGWRQGPDAAPRP